MALDAQPGGPWSEDRLLGGRVLLRQPERGYRAAIDPVLLAASVPIGSGEEALDVGAGTGAAALCLLIRQPGVKVAALERHAEHLALLEANAAINKVAERLSVHRGDLFAMPVGLRRPFARVLTNPPYRAHPGRNPATASGAAANVEEAPLAAWVEACLKRTAPGGSLSVVLPAARLAELAACLVEKAGTITIYPAAPRFDRPASRAVAVAIKGGRGGTALMPALALHGPDGGYTPAAEAVLRDAASLGEALNIQARGG